MPRWTCDFCHFYEPMTARVGLCLFVSHTTEYICPTDPACPFFVNRYDVEHVEHKKGPAPHELPQPTSADPLASRFITVRGSGHPQAD